MEAVRRPLQDDSRPCRKRRISPPPLNVCGTGSAVVTECQLVSRREVQKSQSKGCRSKETALTAEKRWRGPEKSGSVACGDVVRPSRENAGRLPAVVWDQRLERLRW